MLAWCCLAVLWCLPVVSVDRVFGQETQETQETQEAQEIVDGRSSIESGMRHFDKGHFSQAALTWDRAARRFEREQRPDEQAQALLYLAQAFYELGHYERAETTLAFAQGLATRVDNAVLVSTILGRRGNVAFAQERLSKADKHLTESLALARNLEDSGLTATVLNDYGNVLAAQGFYNKALGAFTEATVLAEATGHHVLAVTALVNGGWSALLDKQFPHSKDKLDLAVKQAAILEESHDKARALQSIGQAYDQLRLALQPQNVALIQQAATAYQRSADIAHGLQDHRTASLAWGHLGHLYEEQGRVADALELTRRAIHAAQQGNVPESLYQWEWQMGRLLRTQDKIPDAIGAYRRAVYTLQPIRQELIRSALLQPESFRARVGPLFFEFVDLLLAQTDGETDGAAVQTLLVDARRTMEQFKAAELQDYFRDNCVETSLSRRESVDDIVEGLQRTAVVYPILMPDRLELLISVHDGRVAELRRERVAVTEAQLTKEVQTLRRLLEKRSSREYLPHAQQVYRWVIEPIRHHLERAHVETIVFVPDGPLRTIPLDALHSGEQFLIAEYALAVTPGIVLTEPRPIDRDDIKFLSVGLTDAVQGFPSLPNVASEIESLSELFGGRVLLNQQFQVEELAVEMKEKRPTIVHIASHAKFEGEAKDTFLLAFDGKLTMDRLDELIGLYQFRDSPLDLLTLSACETAAGDERAALGLAGVAVKAGARSALATLWFINDRATSELITEFYRQLRNPDVSKAKALQHAKQQLIHHPTYGHPGYWAPFLLINNWL